MLTRGSLGLSEGCGTRITGTLPLRPYFKLEIVSPDSAPRLASSYTNEVPGLYQYGINKRLKKSTTLPGTSFDVLGSSIPSAMSMTKPRRKRVSGKPLVHKAHDVHLDTHSLEYLGDGAGGRDVLSDLCFVPKPKTHSSYVLHQWDKEGKRYWHQDSTGRMWSNGWVWRNRWFSIYEVS